MSDIDWIGLAALIVSFLLWLFNPGPIRRRLGLEPAPPRSPIVVGEGHKALLRAHPGVGDWLPEDLDEIDWQRDGLMETAEARGWRRFVGRDGRGVARDEHDYQGRIGLFSPGNRERA